MISISNLPLETLWRICLFVDDPYQVYRQLPLLCKCFHQLIYTQLINISANVILSFDDEKDGLLSPPSPLKVHESFIKLGLNSAVENDEEKEIVYCIGSRDIELHASAIPDKALALVSYMEQLMKRGIGNSQSIRILVSSVHIKGRRGSIMTPSFIASFLGALSPLSITFWNWDADLISQIGKWASPSMLRIPNMKSDGNITRKDLSSLKELKSVQRLEFFRPFPRQPWGIESNAFSPLSDLYKLNEIIIKSGRLVGSQEHMVTALCQLPNLSRIDTLWNIDARNGQKLLIHLKELKECQFIHVTSPDFWLALPSFYRSNHTNLNYGREISKYALLNMRILGLHFVQPDAGDLAVLVEGIIRCFPILNELVIRVSRLNEGEYDFFSITREYVERCLRRLEQKSKISSVTLEIGSRMWGSRKSYVDELVGAFEDKFKVRVKSPVGVSSSIDRS